MQQIGAGVKSGKDYDKFKEMHLTKEKAKHVKCPIIKESPVAVECKVKEIKELRKPSHDNSRSTFNRCK